MRLLVLFLVIGVLSIKTYSQQESYKQNIRGVILDDDTEVPLPGASVILLNTNPIIGTISDTNGRFIIKNVPVGRISLRISFIGYEEIVLSNLPLSSGKELVLSIKLKEKVFLTNEVVVKAYGRKDKPINEMATVSARSFTTEETERFAGSLGDPARMVSNYAGVVAVNDSRNDIIIRGNSPAGLLWVLDGVEIPNPNHFGSLGSTGGPISIINNGLLANSDFFTSAWPAQYGNAVSGVFDLRLRSGNNEKHEFLGQVGFNGFEFGAEGPLKKGKASYLVSYRYSTLAVFHAIGFDIGTGEAVPQYQDLTFKIDLPVNKIGKFSVFGMGGSSYIRLYDSEKKKEEKLTYSIGGYDTDFGSDLGVIGMSHLYFFNEKSRIKTTVSAYGTRVSTIVDSLVFDNTGTFIPDKKAPYYRGNEQESRLSFSTEYLNKINKKNLITAGLNFGKYFVDYADSIAVYNGFLTLTKASGDFNLIKSYIQYKHKFSNRFVVTSGIYSQFMSLSKHTSVEPRVGLKYSLSKNQSVSIGYGLHSQTQVRPAYFYQTVLPDGSIYLSNKNLDFTYSNQFVAGYDYLISNNMRVKLESYYQYLTNIPVKNGFPEYSLINSGDDFYLSLEDSLVNEGTGKNYGLEFTFEHFLHKGLYFLMTASIFDSKYTGSDGIERNTAWNGNYVFNALAGYESKILKHGSLNLNFKAVYAGGKRYIPIDLKNSRLMNKTVYDWKNAYRNKFENYFRIDVKISYKLNGRKINQEWSIELQNVTDNKNIFREIYDRQTQNIAYNYQMSFFPIMMYRINF